MAATHNPFDLDASTIERLLDPVAPLLPELEARAPTPQPCATRHRRRLCWSRPRI